METQHSSSFGFQTIDPSQKKGLVQGVFENVASKYDIMNDAMSLGIHRLWKTNMVNWLNPRANQKCLDVAGGTGDIAERIFHKTAGNADVTVFDLTHSMLDVGKQKLAHLPLSWVCGNAEQLPFPDNHFDTYTMAFGMRNVTHIEKALAEAYRVLKPRGRFLCLEFSHPVIPVFDKVYDAYPFHLIPKMGKLIAGDADSYQYLVESIRRFPKQDAFLNKIKAAGFKNPEYRNYTGGVVAVHSGWKI